MLVNKILSDVIHYMKYSNHLHDENRRESFNETVIRNKDMHIKKFPFLKAEINDVYARSVFTKQVLPAMRSLQFAGKAIEANNSRIFNCSYAPASEIKIFSESMFLLLSGVGFGYSVQSHHINQLPGITEPLQVTEYVIADSIEGWADAIDVLINAFLNGSDMPDFDYSQIRKKGMRLITSGGKAPGYKPLKICLEKITNLFSSKIESNNLKLNSLDVHSIFCHIADAVLAGGIRRAAMIALFDFNNTDMRTCKTGEWWINNPEFARANNSAVALYSEVTKDMFNSLWQDIKNSGSGEPGIIWSNNKEYCFNPCAEASLRAFSFCNLVEINADVITNQEHFNQVCKDATFINTLQASYTDFHYLRDIWKTNTDEDALIGVGLTGIASGTLDNINLSQGAEIVLLENERVAKLININVAARSCLVKPAGTSSLILGTSSGIHDWHDAFYIRRIRVNKAEAIYNYFLKNLPELVEDDNFDSNTAIFMFPQKAPDKANLRNNTTAIELLNRTKKFNLEWIRPSHRSGDNYHNVSATINIKDNEWEEVGLWVWENRKNYHGMSFLPFDNSTYQQMPFTTCDKETFDKLNNYIKEIDLSEIFEDEDSTDLNGQVACSGGTCQVI